MTAPDYQSPGVTHYCYDCLWPLRNQDKCPCCGSTDLITATNFMHVDDDPDY